jgi:hypothetical protein
MADEDLRPLTVLLDDWNSKDLDALRELWGEYAQAWLESRWTGHKCSLCGRDEWTIATEPVHLQSWISMRALPLVQVTCETCGNVLLLEAAGVRVVPQGVEVPPAKESATKESE